MLLLLILAASPIRLTVEGGAIDVIGADAGATLPRRDSYRVRSRSGDELLVEGLEAATALLVRVEEGALSAEVTMPAPPGLELVRTKSDAEAARYQLVNKTGRSYELHLRTLSIAPVTEGGSPEPTVRECALSGPVLSRSTMSLGQWDEACFADSPGRYRSTVYLDGDDLSPRVRVVYALSRDFTFTASSGRRVFGATAPRPLEHVRDLVIAPGGSTACVCARTEYGRDAPRLKAPPAGDFPSDTFMMQK